MPTFKEQLKAEIQAHTGVTLCRTEDEERVEQHSRETAEQLDYDFWAWNTATGLRCHTDASKTPTGDEAAALRDLSVVVAQTLNWTLGPAVVVIHDIASVISGAVQQGRPDGPAIARMLHTAVQMQKAITDEGLDQQGQDGKLDAMMEQAQLDMEQLKAARNACDEVRIAAATNTMQRNMATATQRHGTPIQDRVVQVVLCDSEAMPRPCGADSITMELPSRAEVRIILDQFAEQREIELDNQDQILDAVAGLLEYQIRKAVLLAFVQSEGEVEIDVAYLQQYKRQALQAKGITWVDPDPEGFAAIGGLEPLKQWLRARALTFDNKCAAEYNVEPARGVIVAGVPGCGKSKMARMVANEWGQSINGSGHQFPLLYADVGATRSKWIGDSERLFSELLATADAIAGTDGGGCVLWLDEFDRVMAGGEGGELDSGVGARTMQLFLTWAQEHKSRVFIYATCNNPQNLPNAATRAGRFDALWWIDPPGIDERLAICKIYRDRYDRASDVDVDVVASTADGNTGAEIEQAYKNAAIDAMVEQKVQITTDDVVQQLKRLPRTKDTFTLSPELGKWKQSAMKANTPEVRKVNLAALPTSQQSN